MATVGVSKASLRGLRMNDRIKKMREEAAKVQRPTVKVTPKDDTMRRLLRHPRAGGFRKDGSAEWPDDRFTRRRIRDGDVIVVDNEQKAKPPSHSPPQHTHREHEDDAA
jgi:hypothetical protein